MKIVSVGEITIDHYLNLDRSFVGGISLNFAVNAKRCGADTVSLVSSVGTDRAGKRVLEKLEQEGIDASHVAILPGETACIDIQITAQGERIFPSGSYQRNVLDELELNDGDLAFIGQHDILAAPFDPTQPEYLFNEVMADSRFDGKRVADFGVWFDYSQDYGRLVSHLKYLELAFISGNESTISALLPVSRQFNGVIVVTLGAGGSAALVDGTAVFEPAQLVPHSIDPTGCGDAYQAAFTVAYYRTGSIEEALRKGTAQAAAVLQHFGATN